MKRFALFCLTALLTISVVRGDEPAATKLPTAEEVMKKHVEASGGQEALDRQKESTTKVQMTIMPAGMVASGTVYSDGKLNYNSIEIQGFGNFEEGFDGENYWANDAISGPRIITGVERKQKEFGAADYKDYAEWVEKLETQAIETVDGKACYKVLLTLKHGLSPVTLWFNQESGLLVQSALEAITPQGAMPVIVSVSDYREVNGALVPHLTVQKLQGAEIQVRVVSLETGVKHEGSRFEPPAPVKALIEHKNQQEKEKPATETPAETTAE